MTELGETDENKQQKAQKIAIKQKLNMNITNIVWK